MEAQSLDMESIHERYPFILVVKTLIMKIIQE